MPVRSAFAFLAAVTALVVLPTSASAQCIECPPGYGVAVTPDGSATAVRLVSTGDHSAVFTIQNTGDTYEDTYSIGCSGSSNVTCTGTSLSQVTLGPSQSTEVTAYYSVGAVGTGTLTLSVASSNANDGGSWSVPVVDPGMAVTPDDSFATRSANTTGHNQVFTVKNTGTGTETFTIACAGSPNVACTSTSVGSVQLGTNASTTVTAYYNVSDGGAGTLTLTATSQSFSWITDLGSYAITVTLPSGAPRVDASVMSLHKQSYAACAQACFAVTHAQGTVPYFSLSTPRNVTLVYNSDRHNPQQFVHLNVQRDTLYGSTPAEWRLQVKVNGTLVTFTNGDQTLKFSYGSYANGVAQRIGGLFSTTSYSTGVYPMDILVSAYYSGGGGSTITTAITTKLVVVNETSAPVAAGWTLGGIQRLYPAADGSALITEGDGSAVFFQKSSNPGPFVAPAGEFSKLVLDGSGWQRRYVDSTTITFNSAGRMTEVRDRWNNTVTVVYDGSNRVWKVKDPLDTASVLTYGSYGLSSIAAKGRTTTITVDGSNKLTVVKDPDNDSTRFAYDGSSRLSTVTDRRGKATTITYDAWGKVDSVTAPSVTVIKAAGGDTTLGPAANFTAWQGYGVPTTSTASTPAAAVRADTVKASVREPGGGLTRFTVNRWGSPVEVTGPLGYVTTVVYDGNGLPVRATAPTGAVDTIAYNSSGLPTYLRSGPDTSVHVHYAGWGQADTVQGYQRPKTVNVIGSNGRISSSTEGGATTTYHYDSRGRIDSIIDPSGHLLHAYTYSSVHGNLTKDSLPGNRITQWFYDAYGRDSALKAPGFATRRTIYDVVNRPTLFYDGVNATADSTFYDALRPIRVSIKGQSHSVTYNDLGWPMRRTDPAGKTDTLGYSSDGALRRWVNRRGHVTQFTYDALHRALKTWGDSTPTDSIVYVDSVFGRFFTMTDSVSVEKTYLGLHGRPDSIVTQMAGQTYTRKFRYLKSGVVDSIAVSGPGSFTLRRYQYHDTTFVLDSIKLGASLTRLTWGSDKAPSGVTLPGDLPTTFFPSPVHDVAAQTTTAAFAEVVNRYASYDVAQRVQRHIIGTGVTGEAFAYDSLGRVIKDTSIGYSSEPPSNPCSGTQIINADGNACAGTGQWNVGGITSYSYDQYGNRTDLSGPAYGTANRIRSFDGCNYVTDSLGDGNVLRRACGTDTVWFQWTAQSRLKKLKVFGGDSVRFSYDAAGRLVRRIVNTTPSYFLWNGASLLAELDSAGDRVAEYSYYPGLDNLHALIVDTTQYFAHTDLVGNVIALTDSTEGVARTYGYTLWGGTSGGADSVGFTGVDRPRFKGALWMGPDVDLYYMRSRWYEPRSGRFLSEDPIGLAGGGNLYAYGANDPVNHWDPQGQGCYEWAKGYGYRDADGKIHLYEGTITYYWADENGNACSPNGDGGGDPQRPESQECAILRDSTVARAITDVWTRGTATSHETYGWLTQRTILSPRLEYIPDPTLVSDSFSVTPVLLPPGRKWGVHPHLYTNNRPLRRDLRADARSGVGTIVPTRDSVFVRPLGGGVTGCARPSSTP